jgi:hypothetical protein
VPHTAATLHSLLEVDVVFGRGVGHGADLKRPRLDAVLAEDFGLPPVVPAVFGGAGVGAGEDRASVIGDEPVEKSAGRAGDAVLDLRDAQMEAVTLLRFGA